MRLRPCIFLGFAFVSLLAPPARAQTQTDSLLDVPTELAQVRGRLSALKIDKFVTLTKLQKRTEASEGEAVKFSYEVPFDPGMQDQMESEYAKINGQSYWTKILMVIADVTGAKFASISGTGPGTHECGSSYVKLWHGLIYRDEDGCVSAVYYFGVKLPDDGRRLAGDGRTTTTSAFTVTDLENALMQRFTEYGGTSLVRERSDFHRVFTISGMKNIVLKGENVWEKVNVLATIAPTLNQNQQKTYQILLSSDGYIASGIGAAPPITSYDTSMEPKYFKYLDDFNHGLALYLSSQ
jgi:hypothetical protein